LRCKTGWRISFQLDISTFVINKYILPNFLASIKWLYLIGFLVC